MQLHWECVLSSSPVRGGGVFDSGLSAVRAEEPTALEEAGEPPAFEGSGELSELVNVEGPMALSGTGMEESIPIDEAHFPDEWLRKYLLGELDNYEGADTDGDKSLSMEERENVMSIEISGKPVEEFTGIAYFPNLSNLSISNACLTSADLSANAKLSRVSLSSNPDLTEVCLSGCSALNELNIANNAISELDLRECPQLTSLNCMDNKLTSLDLSVVPQLTYLDVSYNPLMELNVSNLTSLTQLICWEDNLSALDVSANKELVSLNCGSNFLMVLDVSGLVKLSVLDCQFNRLSELDLSHNPELINISCSNNQLLKLDISQNTKLESLNIDGNYITALDVSANPLLKMEEWRENWWTANISSIVSPLEDGRWLLDLSAQEGFSPERYTIAEWGDDSNVPELTEQGVIWKNNPVENGDITLILDLNLSDKGYLKNKKLRCNYSLRKFALDESYVELNEANFPDENFRNFLIETYDPDGDGKFQPGLIDLLYLENQKIQDLTGISYFTGLTHLTCTNNQLTELDLSRNVKLAYLSCGENRLTDLDLSRNLELISLDCWGNSILEFDLSNQKLLQCAYIGNQILEVEVKAAEDGTYVAESDLLRSAMDLFNIPTNDENNIFYHAEKMDTGIRWKEAPMKGAYIQSCVFGRPLNIVSEQYQSQREYYLEVVFHNAYDEFDQTEIVIDAEHFPDEAFRNCLKQQYDPDGDGKFQPGLITELYVSGLPELKDLTGIANFTSLSRLSLSDNPNLTAIDVSQNKNLIALYLDRTAIQSLDLRENAKIKELNFWGTPVTSLYLAEDCVFPLGFNNTSNLTATAVAENGRYVLDLSKYGPVDPKRIVGLSDGQLEGEKVYWDSEAEVPITFSYMFLLRSDYEEGMKYDGKDVLNVLVSLTNHAPEMPAGVTIDLTKENFPSESLLQYLKQNFDPDEDEKLNTEEVTCLNFWDSAGLTSLEGIEHLNCLQSLDIYGAPLRSLNLTSNKILTNLGVNNSSLTDLTLTGCPYLQEADLSGNSLTQLDLSQNQMLRSLNLNGNSFTQMDLSKNINLKRLDVAGNAISSMDLSNNTKLQSLSASYNPNMTELKWPSRKSGIKEVRISGNKIATLPIKEMTELEILDVDANGGNLKELNLTNHTKLKELYVNGIFLNINWDQMTSLERVNIWNSDAAFAKIDLSKAVNLTGCSISGISALTELDVHGLTKLGNLEVYSNKLQKLDLTGCLALSNLNCSGNELESLDLSSCSALKMLYCDNNKLKTLDITKNGALQNLYCQYNQLTTIDTTKNPALKWFDCSYNPIVSLDLSNNKAMLTDLNCMSASLTSLDLGDNEVLENVQLENQVLQAPASALQPETAQVRAAGTTGETGLEFALGQNTEVSNAGAASGRYILRLDQYGSFDPAKVKNLSSGTVTAKGILWENQSQIPDQVTYDYDISNRYKLSGKTMPVTIILNGSAPETPDPGTPDLGTNPGITPPVTNPGTNPVPSPTIKKKNLSACKITLKSSSLTYTGKSLKPTVTIKDGQRVLKSGTDYTITYKNNKKPGKATILLTGKGNYGGKVTKYFTIKKAAQKFTYTKSYSKAYGSKAFSLKIKRKAGIVKLTYKSSNSKVATVNKKGKVTIKGQGIAAITVKAAGTAYYNASSIKITIKVTPVKQKIKSLKVKTGKKIVVSWNKDKNATGYQIQYCTSKNFKKGVGTVKVSKQNTTSATLKKLKAGKKYYVRVRSYKTVKSGGKKQTVYGAWSSVKQSGKTKK